MFENLLGWFKRDANALMRTGAKDQSEKANTPADYIAATIRHFKAAGFRGDEKFGGIASYNLDPDQDLSSLDPVRVKIDRSTEDIIYDGRLCRAEGMSSYTFTGMPSGFEDGIQWWGGGGWTLARRLPDGREEILAIRSWSATPASTHDVEIEFLTKDSSKQRTPGGINIGGRIVSAGRLTLQELLDGARMPSFAKDISAESEAPTTPLTVRLINQDQGRRPNA